MTTKPKKRGRPRGPINPDAPGTVQQFAINLKKQRIAAKMSIEELALAVGKELSTIYRWESGHSSPMLNVIRPLAEVLGCKVGDLL